MGEVARRVAGLGTSQSSALDENWCRRPEPAGPCSALELPVGRIGGIPSHELGMRGNNRRSLLMQPVGQASGRASTPRTWAARAARVACGRADRAIRARGGRAARAGGGSRPAPPLLTGKSASTKSGRFPPPPQTPPSSAPWARGPVILCPIASNAAGVAPMFVHIRALCNADCEPWASPPPFPLFAPPKPPRLCPPSQEGLPKKDCSRDAPHAVSQSLAPCTCAAQSVPRGRCLDRPVGCRHTLGTRNGSTPRKRSLSWRRRGRSLHTLGSMSYVLQGRGSWHIPRTGGESQVTTSTHPKSPASK